MVETDHFCDKARLLESLNVKLVDSHPTTTTSLETQFPAFHSKRQPKTNGDRPATTEHWIGRLPPTQTKKPSAKSCQVHAHQPRTNQTAQQKKLKKRDKSAPTPTPLPHLNQPDLARSRPLRSRPNPPKPPPPSRGAGAIAASPPASARGPAAHRTRRARKRSTHGWGLGARERGREPLSPCQALMRPF